MPCVALAVWLRGDDEAEARENTHDGWCLLVASREFEVGKELFVARVAMLAFAIGVRSTWATPTTRAHVAANALHGSAFAVESTLQPSRCVGRSPPLRWPCQQKWRSDGSRGNLWAATPALPAAAAAPPRPLRPAAARSLREVGRLHVSVHEAASALELELALESAVSGRAACGLWVCRARRHRAAGAAGATRALGRRRTQVCGSFAAGCRHGALHGGAAAD